MVSPDPLELAGHPDVAAILAAAAHQHPAWTVAPGVAHVAGWNECRRVLLDHGTFSSDGATYGPVGLAGPAAPGKTLLVADPPHHARLRGIVAPFFSRRAVEARRSRIEEVASDLLDPLVRVGRFEVVNDFSRPFALGVLASILGFPRALEPQFLTLADTITAPAGRSDVERARREMATLFEDVLAQPQAVEAGSLLSALADAAADGRLTADELIAQCIVLVVAGSETTGNLLAATILTLAHERDLARSLTADPDSLARLVEEALRYHSSVQAAVRYTTGPTCVAGIDLPERTPVFVWVGAANRDRVRFVDPDRFDPERVGPHLAFGLGIHTCLGHHLARAELAIALRAVVTRCPDLRLSDDEPIDWIASPLARGPRRVPVVLGTGP